MPPDTAQSTRRGEKARFGLKAKLIIAAYVVVLAIVGVLIIVNAKPLNNRDRRSAVRRRRLRGIGHNPLPAQISFGYEAAEKRP